MTRREFVALFAVVALAPPSLSCVACHGVGSHPVPVPFVGECTMPVV
jgi:hypothetical protein